MRGIGRRRERVSTVGAQGDSAALDAPFVVRHPLAADEMLCVSKPERLAGCVSVLYLLGGKKSAVFFMWEIEGGRERERFIRR